MYLRSAQSACAERFCCAVQLAVTIDRRKGTAVFDFAGTGPEVYGNTNAPPAVTYSAIIYSLRCMVHQDIPLNQVSIALRTILLGAVSDARADACALTALQHLRCKVGMLALTGVRGLTSHSITGLPEACHREYPTKYHSESIGRSSGGWRQRPDQPARD